MGGLRMPELLVIGLIVLLLFGPGKLAGLGKGLGEGIRDFKKAMSGEDEKKPERLASGEQQSAGAPSTSAASSTDPVGHERKS